MKRYFKGLNRDTFLLALTSLFADISTEMLYPVLPIFLTTYLKSSGSVVGLIEGVATATQYIQMGISGFISDKLERRKPLAFAGYLIATISKPIIGFSTAWTGVLFARFLDRIGTGTRSAPRYALVAESTGKDNRGKAFGLEGVGDNLGAFLGPLLTVFLLFSLNISIREIFFLSLIPGIFATFLILLVRERKDGEKSRYTLTFSIKKFPRQYFFYLFSIAILGIGNISSSFMILMTRNNGVSLIHTILIYALFNLVAALASYPSGFISDKFGRRRVLVFSTSIFFVTLIGFAVTKNVFVIVILFALYGIYQGIFRTVGNALASDLVPSHLRASGIGWFNATLGITGLIASLIAGFMYDKVSYSALFITASVFAGTSSFLIYFLLRKY